MSQRKTRKALAIGRNTCVFGQFLARIKGQHDPAGLKKSNACLTGGCLSPTQSRIESATTRQIGDTQRNETNRLLHGDRV